MLSDESEDRKLIVASRAGRAVSPAIVGCPLETIAAARLAALPALGELSLDLFFASAAAPWLFHRFKRRKGLAQNSSRLRGAIVFDHHELRPAFDGRQLAGGGR